MFDPYRKRRERAAASREAKMGAVDFSLPVDGDLPTYRTPSVKAGDLLDSLVADLTRDRSPFFDEVCAKWGELFPDFAAKPGKWVAGDSPDAGGKLFLNVKSAAASFAVRPKLKAVKAKLAGLASAPKRFSVHVQVGG
jgi:hypothetical protein